MTDTAGKRPPLWYWMISVALLLWGLGGASIYVAYLVETPEEFARTAETAANRQAYEEYVENIPAWAVAAGIVAALTRLLGAVCLLVRRIWALPLYIISMVLFVAVMLRAFVFADAATAMSGTHVAVELMFVTLGLVAIWIAHAGKSRGMLR